MNLVEQIRNFHRKACVTKGCENCRVYPYETCIKCYRRKTKEVRKSHPSYDPELMESGIGRFGSDRYAEGEDEENKDDMESPYIYQRNFKKF